MLLTHYAVHATHDEFAPQTLCAFVIEEAFELAAANRVLQFANRLCLDLADALAGDLEDSADFLERVCVAVADAVTQFDNFAFAVGQAS